jgi:mannose-1-phosphate guanylyltransferase
MTTTPFVAVIMAGGKGQRFWPLSTSDKPKQFLDLERSGRSLLQQTFDRIKPLVAGVEHILVATAERYLALVKEQLPELPKSNILIEPVGRDSAPAIALASLEVQQRFGNVISGFFSSDHRIPEQDVFTKTIQSAIQLADKQRGLVTIGIVPSRAAIGYGYIQAGEASDCGSFRVAQFVEKPNQVKAQSYLEAGTYYWNAGIFVWPSEVILQELRHYAPDIMEPLEQAFSGGRVSQVFPNLRKIPIDFAVMEQTKRAFVIPGAFSWDDIGDWVALERLLEGHKQESNTVLGTHVGYETAGNIIYTESSDDIIVTVGVKDLVIVKQGNTVLLVHKDHVQDLKKVLENEKLNQLTVV